MSQKQQKFSLNEVPRRKDRLYHLWNAMKSRCNNPNNISYKWYSQKNIKVCEEWEKDFDSFKKWALENGYDYSKSRKEQSLDRIDNQKGYCPENCRFITHSANCRNTSRNINITYNGETKTAIEWAESLNLSPKMIAQRAKKTDDVRVILDTEKRAHRSNTGIKGISLIRGRYHVYINHKYIGSRKSLEEAKELKDIYAREKL